MMHPSEAIANGLSHVMMRNAVLNSVLADDGDGTDDRMLVMNDGDGARLLMDVYMTYVSEWDFSNFPKFMKDVDRLLYKARGNKPFTHEDRKASESDTPAPRKRTKRKSPRPAPTPAATPPAVTASDIAHAMTACM